ncbi:MAG TPA: hypothetical protein VFG43_09680 [Geminicoccaceae bacterium]|nr:hypothetical protein [Geminicoccaceae bacterium]
MNRTAKLMGVSTPTVQAWIERSAKDHAPKPDPDGGGRALAIELDGMWHYLKEGPTSSGRLGIGPRGGSSWTGSAAVAIELPSGGC